MTKSSNLSVKSDLTFTFISCNAIQAHVINNAFSNLEITLFTSILEFLPTFGAAKFKIYVAAKRIDFLHIYVKYLKILDLENHLM